MGDASFQGTMGKVVAQVIETDGSDESSLAIILSKMTLCKISKRTIFDKKTVLKGTLPTLIPSERRSRGPERRDARDHSRA